MDWDPSKAVLLGLDYLPLPPGAASPVVRVPTLGQHLERMVDVAKIDWAKDKVRQERRDYAADMKLGLAAAKTGPRPASAWDPTPKGSKGGPVRRLSPEEIRKAYPGAKPPVRFGPRR